MKYVLIINFAIQLIFAICYVLWQFNVFNFEEETMTHIIVFMDILETVILVITRFYKPEGIGKYMLAGFYILETVLLLLQLFFANLGISIKIKSILWIAFYVFLFALDIKDVNLITTAVKSEFVLSVDTFLQNSWFGEVVSAIILAGFKSLFAYWLEKENSM